MKFPARTTSFVRFAPICLLIFSSAYADVLVLKNGDRISGDISRIWDGEVTIEPEYSDEFAVEISAIEYIESEREFEIDLEDGRSLLATFAGADADGNQLVTADNETVSVPLADLFELDEPEEPFAWESNVEVSANINRGNTDTSNGMIRADTLVRFNDHRHLGEITFFREDLAGVRTKEQDLFKYNYNYLFKDPWFFASTFTFERDPIINLDSRVIVTAGIGRDIWNTPRRSLNIQLGAGFQQEQISSARTDSSVGTWTLRYRQDFFEDVDLFHNHTITANITGRTNTSYRTSTGLGYEITDLLTTTMTLNFNYETHPVDLAEHEDLNLMFGLSLEFE